MNRVIVSTMALCIAALSIGCTQYVDEGEEFIAQSHDALRAQNAGQLNGTAVNSSFLNGTMMNGTMMNGTMMNGTMMNGTAFSGTRADNGIVVSGLGWAGADMNATLGDSSNVVVHVQSVSDAEVPGLYTYVVTHGGVSICGNDAQGNPIHAIPLQGVWDYATASPVADSTQVTFACRGAALAKCIEWGYASEGTMIESHDGVDHVVPMSNLHEACTRMVRADYCGTGVSLTVTGTPIEIWDSADIQLRTAGSTLPFEAEWSAKGATCIKHTRWANVNSINVETYIQNNCPSRWTPTSTSCGGATAASGSTYFPENGFALPYDDRPWIRNESDPH